MNVQDDDVNEQGEGNDLEDPSTSESTEDYGTDPSSSQGDDDPDSGKNTMDDKSWREKRLNPVLEKNKELESKLSDLTTQVEELRKKPEPKSGKPPSAEDEAIQNKLNSLGYLSKNELDKTVAQVKEDIIFENKMEALEKRYDGKDGRPKFNKKEILEWGDKNQIYNPEAAYEHKFRAELDKWKIEQATGGSTSTKIAKGKGQRQGSPQGKELSSKDGSLKDSITERLKNAT